MQKNVMALAVAGVLAAPVAAFAQANYEIYGRANLGLDQYSATGATPPNQDLKSRMRVFDSGSRVGFRGAEDLGGGLKAVFQIESGVNIDTGSANGQNGAGNASTGFWASRDSFVGLDGGFGRVTLGRQSIFWANGVINQFGANYVNTEVPWTNGAALATSAGVARQNNVLAYTTPTVSGLNGTLSYSPDAGEAQQGSATVKPDGKITGLTVRYTSPFVAQFDWVNRKANSGADLGGTMALPTTGTNATEATQWKLGVGYNYMPGGLVTFIYSKGERKDVNGTKADSAGWTLNAEHTIGGIQVLAQYGVQGKVKVGGSEVADSGAKAYLIGARYFLSKRTWTYLTYTQTTNENAQNRDYTGASITSATTTPAGADPKIIALGILHNF